MSRSRRWLICISLGLLALTITGFVIATTIQRDDRDYAITITQRVQSGVLLDEDYAACRMEIDLHGRDITADTSCATNSSFPAGTQISVVQDPSDPERFLVVDPDQDWAPAPADTLVAGGFIGFLAAGFIVFCAHRILLHRTVPDSPMDRKSGIQPDRAPDATDRSLPAVGLDKLGESWEAKKAAARHGWLNFMEMDIRIRGTLLSALIILVTGALIALGSSSHAEREYDSYLVRTQPVVDTILLDLGDRDMNPAVRFGTKAIELDHGLRGEFFRNIGETVPVVEDPQIPERLIPTEFADSLGPWGTLRDNAAMILGWIALVGFLGWLLIPGNWPQRA